MIILDFASEDPYFDTVQELDGVTYVLRMLFDFRAARWTFDLLDELEDPIVTGIRLIPGLDLLEPFTDPRLPPGALECVTRAQGRVPPGFADLGVDAAIVYLDPSDLSALDTLFELTDVPIEVKAAP